MLLVNTKHFILLGVILVSCYAAPPNDTINYPCLGTNVTFSVVSYKGATNLLWVHLHANEKTAVKVIENSVKKYGGTAIRLINDSDRNLKFLYKEKLLFVDPNRIYTKIGIEMSLVKLNSGLTASDKKFLVDTIYNSFLPLQKYMSSFKLIIALHNNTNGKYSVRSYSSNEKEFETDSVSINEALDSDNFVLTNNSMKYRKLKIKQINSIYQKNKFLDDGSLVIWTIQNNINYFNVEAENGMEEEQMKMVDAILTD